MRILIKNGHVWNGESFFLSDVLTNNEGIECISKHINQNADYTIDAKGKFVLPGLIDAHTHLCGISSIDIGAQAEMACFPFGVTATADAEGIYGCKERLNFLAVKNTVFAKALIENDNVNIDDIKQKLTKYGEKAVGVKIFFDAQDPNVRSAKPLRQICEFASANSLIVMVHPINAPVPMAEVLDNLKTGDILTHPFHGGNNNAADDNYKSIVEAKRRGVITDLGFEGYVNTNLGFMQDAIAMGIEPDIISTDLTKVSLCMRGGKYGLTMCMSVARKMGMSDETIFKAVTSTPARVLGKGGEWGCLKEGGCADIAIIDYADEGFDLTDMFGNHISSNHGYKCMFTISNGNVVYRM